jgi:glycerol-3-phosphate cytidylyltransferase
MDKKNKIIGITFSCFDLLHAGHVQMLEDAKLQCDYLIVALQTDPTIDRKDKNAPTQSLVERYIQLKGCRYVDEIVPYETEEDLITILNTFNLNVRIVGEEYRDKDFTGKDICIKRNIKIYYNSRQHNLSSTELRCRIKGGTHERKNM